MLLSMLPILLLLSHVIQSEGGNEGGNVQKVVHCHSHQITELGDKWNDLINDSDKENCTNNVCMMLWGLTKDKKTRILAQGCAKGSAGITMPEDRNGMQNYCPGGGGVGPQNKPILLGEEGAAILRTLTHIQICLCDYDWCNAPLKKDGESCEGDQTAFCTPLDAAFQPASASDYSVEAIKKRPIFIKKKPIMTTTTPAPHDRDTSPFIPTDSPLSQALGGYFSGKDLPGGGIGITDQTSADNEDDSHWFLHLFTTFWGVLIILFALFLIAACTFGYAILKKHLWPAKQDQSNRSTRIASLSQVTILNEVAQGYQREAEELINECHAGGPHQIANWKYNEDVKLGTGSFGAVYKVDMIPDYLVDGKVSVAMKTFNYKRSTHFFNESRTLKYVHDCKNHPNIIQYLGRAVDCRDTLEEATWRIALELCDGGSLRNWITSTHITLTQYLEAASGLLSALSFLHAEQSVQTALLSTTRGNNSVDSGNADSVRSSSKHTSTKKKSRIAHCDINSRNILVRNPITGNIALADFGLALTENERRQEELQIKDIGTIRYLAPELLKGVIEMNDKIKSLILADTYATGLVLWELLSRTVELYDDDSEVPAYSAPYQKELNETEGTNTNIFDAMNNVVVKNDDRPKFGGKWNDLKEREEESMNTDEDSGFTDEERFLHTSIIGIQSMMAQQPDARSSIPSMAEKVDVYRLRRPRNPERAEGNREDDDSLLEEENQSGSS